MHVNNVMCSSEPCACHLVGALDANMDENEAQRRIIFLNKSKKSNYSRGLSFKAAEEVMQKFNQMAITKQRVSFKEQVSKEGWREGEWLEEEGCRDKMVGWRERWIVRGREGDSY